MLVAANLISLVGCVMMVGIGFVRKKERILLLQCAQFGFLAASNLMLGATSGFISGVISIVRNLIYTKKEPTVWLKVGFILVQVALTAGSGIHSPVEILPILAAVIFTWFLDVKNPVHFKLALIAAQAMWMVYDLSYRNYVTFVFDILTILSNFAGILMIVKNEKHR